MIHEKTSCMKKDYRKNRIKELLSERLSKERRREFAELDEVDALLKKQWNDASESDADLKIKEQIWQKITDKRMHKMTRYFRLNIGWQVVAATVALLITTAGWWLVRQPADLSDDFIEITAEGNQLYTLPDSSKVWMQQGSSLKYAKAFQKERKVWLKGNSLFEVTRQNGVPFQVYINEAMIEVKGTSFDVHQNSDLQTNEVILYSGKVDFTAAHHETVEMQPLQKITHDVELGEIKQEQIHNISYKNGCYQFTDLPLKQLIETVNCMYNSHIRLEGINLKKQSAFTGKIRLEEPLQDVLQKICFSLSLQIKTDQHEIIIYKQ